MSEEKRVIEGPALHSPGLRGRYAKRGPPEVIAAQVAAFPDRARRDDHHHAAVALTVIEEGWGRTCQGFRPFLRRLQRRPCS